MINLGSHYTLSGPPTFAQLNHAISYLPEFGIYADTTAGTAPFGTLPFEEYGKPVVHAVASGHALRTHAGACRRMAASMELRTTARLDDDGSIDGTTLTTATRPVLGRPAAQRVVGAGEWGGQGPRRCSSSALGTDGAGAFAFAPPDELEQAYEMSGSFRLDPRPEILDGDSFAPPVGLRVLVRPGDLLLGPLGSAKLAEDEPTPCYAGRQMEDLTLDLPPERRIAQLPPDVEIDNEVLCLRVAVGVWRAIRSGSIANSYRKSYAALHRRNAAARGRGAGGDPARRAAPRRAGR